MERPRASRRRRANLSPGVPEARGAVEPVDPKLPMVAAPPTIALVISGGFGYGPPMIRAIAQYANQRGWHLHLVYGDYPRGSDLPRAAKLSGIIAWPKDLAMVRRLRRSRVPAVNVNPAYADRLPTVAQNHPAAGRLAAEYFRRCGFTNFGFHGYQVDTILDDCRDAYRDTIAGFGGECRYFEFDNRGLKRKHDHLLEYMRHLRRWLQRLPKPIAVLVNDAIFGRDTANACADSGIHVPDEVAILCVGRSPLYCEVTRPELSQLDQGWERIALLAAECLDRMIHGETPLQTPRYLEPIGIVERHSTNAMAIDDANVSAALRFIRENACRGIHVTDVVQAVPCSRRMLESLFRQRLSRSPREEITRVKVERAKRLLAESDASMRTIGKECGFQSAWEFSRIFRRETGQTPRAFRKSRLQGAPQRP